MKYDQKSLSDAAGTISRLIWSVPTKSEWYPKLSLLHSRYDPTLGDSRLERVEEFSPHESWETFLTRDFFTDFNQVQVSAVDALDATCEQADYAARGLKKMAKNIKRVEDAEIVNIFHTLDKTQDRDA